MYAPARAAAVGLLAAMVTAPVLAQQAGVTQTLAQANQALQAGEADKALALLHSLPQGGIWLAEAQNLACRVHLTLQQWDAAERECEQAVRLDSQNTAGQNSQISQISNDHLWLGRALGEKADRASFLTAFSLGKKVRMEFETAVRLNPRNAEALTDLGEFYEEAPGVVGGGAGKAEGVAAQLDKVEPARAHQLRARIAEARKDYGAAEREFKQAIATAAQPALHWTTLASFYRRRERWPEMEWAIHNCVGAEERDKHAAVALYDGAGVLTQSNRDPALAARMLEDYLASSSKTEEAPAFEAHLRLARLKKQLGDAAGGQRELAAALQLAHDYKPALDFKF
jgi:tetratricopeptide (TPR) repeat protein